jgi:Flp pilus assembly CpaF family ATPase
MHDEDQLGDDDRVLPLRPADEKRSRQRGVLAQAIGPRLAELFEDPQIREIDVNANGSVFVEKLGAGGGTLDTGIQVSKREARRLVMTIAAELATQEPGIVLDETHPNLNGKLDYTETEFVRVALTAPPAVEQHTAEIRKHSSVVIPLERHVETGMMTTEQYEAICSLVDGRQNIFIVGSMFSGKTTLANGMLKRVGDVDPSRRYGYIEDVRELVCPLRNCKPVLVTKAWPIGEIMPEVVRWNLQTITISELRNGIVANHLLSDLWIQGHDGGLTTFHANTWRKALWRVEALMRTYGFTPQRDLIAAAIGGIVTMRFSHALGRKITGVYELLDEVDARSQYQARSLAQEIKYGDEGPESEFG